MSPVNVSTIGSYIREQREQARISLRQLAQAAGVSNPYLSQIERGLRRPSADILQQIAKGLRISAEALYVQAGLLEDRPPGSAVRDAVLTDPDLTERQKQMMIEIYESFRKETTVMQSGEPDDDEATDVDIDRAALAWPEELEPAALAKWAIAAGPDSEAAAALQPEEGQPEDGQANPAAELQSQEQQPEDGQANPAAELQSHEQQPEEGQANPATAVAGQPASGEAGSAGGTDPGARAEGATSHAFPSTYGTR
jgi:transcriptional regulator with XRE-family HTH domain